MSVSSVGDPFRRFPVPGPFFFIFVGLFLEGATAGCNASEQNIGLKLSQTELKCEYNKRNSRYLSNVKRYNQFLFKPNAK